MASAKLLQPGEGAVLKIGGETVHILADSATTDGKCVIMEVTSPPGNGPPLHRHGRDDEYFFVAEGTAKFSLDGRESIVGAGGTVAAPRGSVHAYVNIGATPSRIIVTCCPGGIEVAFREVDQIVRAGNATHEEIVAVFKRAEVEIIGPPLSAARP